MRILVAILFSLLSMSMSADDNDLVGEMENNSLRIRQKPATEQLLADYLKQADIKEDTVYAILYKPRECPRCEMYIRSFLKVLHRVSPESKSLLISVFYDKEIAQHYNTENKYLADYNIYDTSDDYFRIFSFNMGDTQGLYILKLCPKQGVMITGGQPTVMSSKFAKQFIATTSVLPSHDYMPAMSDECANEQVDMPKGDKARWKTEELKLAKSDSYYVSKLYGLPKFKNGYFFFNDDLSQGVEVFENQGNNLVFKGLAKANEAEQRHFVKLSDHMLKWMEDTGQLYYIPLTPQLGDDGTLMVSYSLPNVFYEDGDTNRVAYYNAGAIVSREVATLSPLPIKSLGIDATNSKMVYKHFDFHRFAGRIWVGCQKITWPMDGFEKEDIIDKPALNQFCDEFYDADTPFLAALDEHTGSVLGHYGKLEEFQRKARTGYSFVTNIYAHHGRELMYSNGTTGVVYVADSSNVATPTHRYCIFDIHPDDLPAPDTTMFYNREYSSHYRKAFSRGIEELWFDDHTVIALVRHSLPEMFYAATDRYSLVTLDRRTGRRKEYVVPQTTDGRMLGCGLRTGDGSPSPFVFVRRGDEFIVRTYRLR